MSPVKRGRIFDKRLRRTTAADIAITLPDASWRVRLDAQLQLRDEVFLFVDGVVEQPGSRCDRDRQHEPDASGSSVPPWPTAVPRGTCLRTNTTQSLDVFPSGCPAPESRSQPFLVLLRTLCPAASSGSCTVMPPRARVRRRRAGELRPGRRVYGATERQRHARPCRPPAREQRRGFDALDLDQIIDDALGVRAHGPGLFKTCGFVTHACATPPVISMPASARPKSFVRANVRVR